MLSVFDTKPVLFSLSLSVFTVCSVFSVSIPQVIFIGGNPYLSNIRDCLNAHFSGNDGLPVGAYLSGPGRRKWKKMSVRWMSVPNSHEVAYYLLEDYQRKNGQLPLYNNPVIVDDSAGSESE